MKRFLNFTLALLAILICSGCASLSSRKSPSADLQRLKTLYVQKLPADERGIEQIISDQLSLKGYQSSVGVLSRPPYPVDAIVTYQDRWMWDITMYMTRLNIQIRSSKTGAVLASGESFRGSLRRKTPEGMVQEVLDDMLRP